MSLSSTRFSEAASGAYRLTSLATLAPGDTRECQEVLASNDDVSTVTDFYAGKLSTGDWKITSDDRATGELKFARVSRPLTVGVVDMLGRGQHTVIQIKLDS